MSELVTITPSTIERSTIQPTTALATMASAEILVPAAIPPGSSKFPVETVYSFCALHGKLGEGQVFAFTSAHRKEGVTHVVHLLGAQLASYCGQDVLIVRPPNLRSLSPLDVERIDIIGRRDALGLWTLPEDLPEREAHDAAPPDDLWHVLRARFRYVLLDCSALDVTGDILSLAPRVDGMVLVVKAGETTKADIQKAVRLLSLGSSSPFAGCILNQRTYPIPGFLYRNL